MGSLALFVLYIYDTCRLRHSDLFAP
jgi:hypothetical protein